MFKKDLQYYKFSFYGFLKNLQFFDPYLILFFREVGMSYFQIGVLFSVREIGTNILEIPTGVMADAFGRRRAMMGAFAAYILSFAVFFFFPHFTAYIGAMALFSVGEALRSGTHKAMILDYLKRNDMTDAKVHYYGHTRSWSQRGSALSALIAGVIVFYSGSYRNVFLYSIIPYIFGFLLIKSYPGYLDYSSEAESGKSLPEAEENGKLFARLAQHMKASVAQTIGEFRSMLTYKPLRRLLLNSSIHDGVFKTVKDYVQPIMRNLALSMPIFLALADRERIALIVGLLYFVLYIFTSIVSQNSGKVSERFVSPEKGLNFTYLSSVGLVMAVGISMFFHVPAVGVLLFIGLYVFQNLRRPMTVGYVSENIKGTVMATGLSVESQLKTLFVAIVAPAFGGIADMLGLNWAMLILAAFPLITYPIVRIQKQEQV